MDIKTPDTINTDLLEPLDYDYRTRRDIHIVIEQPE